MPRPQPPDDYTAKLHGLMRAALAMNSAGALAQTLQVITDQARFVIGAHQAITTFTVSQRLDQAAEAISLSDKYAAYRTFDEKSDGTGIYRLVVEQNRPFRLTQAELERHPAWRGFGKAAGRHPPLRGWLAVPIVDRQSKNLGLIQLSDKYEGEFTEADEAVLVQLAQMASVSTENARLSEERDALLAREHAARIEAEQAVRARNVFLSVASHELRTPLSALRLGVESVARASEHLDGDALRESMVTRSAMLRRQVDQLEALVGELLDVSRIATGQLALRIEPVDLVEVIREVVARLAESASGAGCTVTVVCPDAVVGQWDRTRLDQVITNLLSNALKYGAGKPVELRLECAAGRVRLSVRDHGIGIASDKQGRLFQQFERLAPELHHGGLGLGLWIVRQITERLDGSVSADSRLGEGATFTVELPIDAEEARSRPR
jgi:signal transduction histidine kinase